MIKKFLAGLGIGQASKAGGEEALAHALSHAPYKESYANFLYNLVFCDDPGLFRNDNTAKGNGFWAVLLADEPDYAGLEKIASNPEEESRARVLAYNRMRAGGCVVPAKLLLGVIFEVALEQGLDTLAAYPDGQVRYLNQSGKVAIFDGGSAYVEALAKELVAVSQPIVNAIGPWDRKRLPPPPTDYVRMTFLVSDGLYFGEAPFATLQRDAMGGPVLAKATELLQACVAAAVKSEQGPHEHGV
ncbi:hypothetical protein [Rhodanobacter sp. L36]|uniref:hypothetical protein n=1 Tax=Rhodanobacter sp. L36 TaxID=1747221 RepID=UPI00131DAFD8|nr:hypothetical protein [Rhodanobacter sp. L36]